MAEREDDGAEVDGRTFRPYLLTGGRTRPVGPEIPFEALVVRGPAPLRPDASAEQRAIYAACRMPVSIAELAVELRVPIGVARVLVGDLAGGGHVEVCDTVITAEAELVKRLIAGVRSL